MPIDQIGLYDISFLSFILLIILYVTSRFKRDHYSFTSHLIKYILFLTMIGVILEPITWIVDQQVGTFYFIFGYVTNSLLFLSGTVLVGLWASYWDYKINGSKKRIVERLYFLYPAILQALLLIYNLFVPAFFEIIPGTNLYVRKSFYLLLYVINYGLLVYVIIYAAIHFKRINKRIMLAFIAFMSLPIINSVVQLFAPGVFITWPSLSLSVLVVYLFLETTTGNIDDLTRLYTRRLLELHLTSLIEDKKSFHAIMIDLDRFKDINDYYGHVVGDRVLAKFASILTACKPSEDAFISRLGGDEFFIIHQDDHLNLEDLIQNIHHHMRNDAFMTQFSFLDFSLGAIQFEEHMTMDDVLNISDRHMYEQKKTHKQK